MAKFFSNLRESADQSNPDAAAFVNNSNNRLPLQTSSPFERTENPFAPSTHIKEFIEDTDARREWKQDIDRQVQETAPLREEIRKASNGRVLVDKSIYNKTALERILNTVKSMHEFNGGTLRPGYTVISNAKKREMRDGTLGEARYADYYHLNFPDIWYQLFPRQNYGNKNVPYRVVLNYANNYDYHDALAREALDSGWSIQNFNDDDVESATHAHELAHTAYYDALKNTKNPQLSTGEERDKIEKFRQTHPSLQEIFDIAARNTGYDTVQDAAASVSEYALNDANYDARIGGLNTKNNWSPNYMRLAELFAEAYTDCLYNKENASDYSKEIIKLYSKYINDYNNTFGTKIKLNSPSTTPSFGGDNFVKNLRRASITGR